MHEIQMYKENSEKDSVQVVKSLLEKILKELQEGTIPDENEILNLDDSFRIYREKCSAKRKNVAKTEIQAKEKPFEPKVNDTASINESIHVPSLTDEFFKSKDNITLLKQFVFKKIIAKEALEQANDATEYLINHDLIIQISQDVTNTIYYCLTERGWKFLQEQETKKYLRSMDPGFLLPEKLCIHSVNLDDQLYRRLVMIREFYARKSIADYYVYTDYKFPNMLFGCAINNSDFVCYCYAGASGSIEESQEISRLNEIMNSEKIEELVIITNGTDGLKQPEILHKQGLGSFKNLYYYNLTENIKSE